MLPEIVPLLVCPECASRALQHEVFEQDARGRIIDGVLWCGGCQRWYPVEGGVLELLPDRLAYRDDRAGFWSRHRDRLAARGLRSDGPRPSTREMSPQAVQQEHFDWYARNDTQTYDAYERTPFWQAVDSTFFREWRRVIASGTRLLDVGCAQGRSSAHLMDCDLTLVGFDVSKALVRQAHARYANQPAGARAVFFAADASRFPFVDASFDYVLVYGVLHHLDDPASACGEIGRVLKRGGMYFGLENNTTVLRPVFDFLQRLRPLWHEEAGAKALMSARELVGWLSRAGMTARAHSSVFLPPHVANRLSPPAAQRCLEVVDAVFGKIPFVRDQGGLLVASGTKS